MDDLDSSDLGSEKEVLKRKKTSVYSPGLQSNKLALR